MPLAKKHGIESTAPPPPSEKSKGNSMKFIYPYKNSFVLNVADLETQVFCMEYGKLGAAEPF